MNNKEETKYPIFLNNIAIIIVIVLTLGLSTTEGGAFILGCFLVFGMLYARNRINFEETLTKRELKLELLEEKIEGREEELVNINTEIEERQNELENLNTEYDKLFEDYENNFNRFIAEAMEEYTQEGFDLINNLVENNELLDEEIKETVINHQKLSADVIKLDKQLLTHRKKLIKYKTDLDGIKNFVDNFEESIDTEEVLANLAVYDLDNETLELVDYDLHAMNSKELRKKLTAVNKEIANVYVKYDSRFTDDVSQTIYRLTQISLQTEVITILQSLVYGKIEDVREEVRDLTVKYLTLSSKGNPKVSSAMAKFLTELQPLYLEAVEIEYEYYIKKEQEREEQQILKEQMRLEKQEQKEIEEQKKKLEQEQAKYDQEIARANELLAKEMEKINAQAEAEETSAEQALIIEQLKQRMAELEQQQLEVIHKKEDVLRLAKGKAGYVYVISNVGSFGENVFKVGMTRRMNPQDRVDELGDASVPFKFDVHAMIFSDDAVDLESKLHQRLADKRLNKINLRKEFFVTDINELENLVQEIDPTAEFNSTLVGKEYYKSLEMAK